MTEKQMVTKENGSEVAETKAARSIRYEPAVDIYETEAALVMVAEMPGVDEQGLEIEIANGILTMEGERSLGEGEEAMYYRQFKLSEQINGDAGSAELKDGLLTLRLPKSEEAKPKKIAVKTLH